jgi:hypothetical protein
MASGNEKGNDNALEYEDRRVASLRRCFSR